MSLIRSLFAVKSVESSLAANHALRRALGLKDLIVLGLG